MTQSTESTLAELATRYPNASRVFHQHELDYCCGGQRSLADVCRERGLDADALLADIEACTGDEPRWDEVPLTALIARILTRFHEPLRQEMPQLIAMARKVEAVHADKDGCPRGLGAHLAMMGATLEEHLQKEEDVLFPMITSGHGESSIIPVRALMREHDDQGFNLREIRRLTNDLTPPAEACTTWRALYLRLDELQRDLMEHVHLENNVLFPRALSGDSAPATTTTS